jgi:DNA-binding transcriptional ArsR family regulator
MATGQTATGETATNRTATGQTATGETATNRTATGQMKTDNGTTADSLAAWAALLADRTRAAFCLALLDGRAWTVSELARHAAVALSTASEHADRLVAGGLLTQHRQGRHRYLSLAGPEVAALIEAVAAAGAPRPEPAKSLSSVHRQRNLAFARTCYDHLAGELGVALADAMTGAGLLSWDRGLTLTDRGAERLTGLGIELTGGRRPALRSCLDWTERRPHLGGAIGAALCRYAFEAGWIVRVGSGRAVQVTPAGARGLAEHFTVTVSAAAPGSNGAATATPGAGRRL